MSIDTNSLQTFTLAEHLKLVEHAIASLMVGGASYTINGRTFTRADLDKLRQWRTELKAEVEADESTAGGGSLPGGIARARFNTTR